MQALVRIYNRGGFLTNMQDLEFAIYGSVYQAGKNREGTAGMGGNGQFNRLSALDSIVEEAGPWRDRLTEDQDIGLRLLSAGWRSHQEVRAEVHQQGVPRLRPLLRQRTRWAQGNLQSIDLLASTLRAPFSRGARLEEALYLFMPLWQTAVGLGFVTAVVLCATGQVGVRPVGREHPRRLPARVCERRARLLRRAPWYGLAQLALGDHRRAPVRALHLDPVPRDRAGAGTPAEHTPRLGAHRPRAVVRNRREWSRTLGSSG